MSEDLINSLKKLNGVRTYTDEDGKFHITTISEEKEKIQKEWLEKSKESNRMKCVYSEVACDECKHKDECLVYHEVESLGYEIENLQEEF